MNSIAQSALAGLIAALAATAILLIADYVNEQLSNRKDVEQIRDILIQGRARVMEAEDTFHEGTGAWMKADVLRAAQYNSMINELQVALEMWTVHLSLAQRKDVYDALDWFHIDGLFATERDGEVEFIELPYGRWPTREMSIEHATRKFEQLQSVDWLNIQDD